MSDTNTAQPSAIELAIKAAQEAAAVATAAAATAISTQPAANTNTAVGMPMRPGAKMSMDDMTGGLTVDCWLKVNEHGLEINKKLIMQGLKVSIDMSAVQVAYAAKYGNPANYIKTYDRVLEAKGGSWEAAMAKAIGIAPNTREYRTADVPMVLMEEVLKVSGLWT